MTILSSSGYAAMILAVILYLVSIWSMADHYDNVWILIVGMVPLVILGIILIFPGI